MFEVNVLDVASGLDVEDHGHLRVGVKKDFVGHHQARQSVGGRARRPTHAAAEPHKDWTVGDVAHGDVRDGYIFEHAPIDTFQCETAAVIKNAVVDSYVFESAV